MDLQERLQAVQAEHQDITQQIAEADAEMAENQRAYEESQGNYYAARANAQLQVRFLEGQMALLSEMMQAEALKQTQGIDPKHDQWTETERRVLAATGLEDFVNAEDFVNETQPDAVLNRAWSNAVARENAEKTLPMLNGTQENSQPN